MMKVFEFLNLLEVVKLRKKVRSFDKCGEERRVLVEGGGSLATGTIGRGGVFVEFEMSPISPRQGTTTSQDPLSAFVSTSLRDWICHSYLYIWQNILK